MKKPSRERENEKGKENSCFVYKSRYKKNKKGKVRELSIGYFF